MTDLITLIKQNATLTTGTPATKEDITNRLIILQTTEFAPPVAIFSPTDNAAGFPFLHTIPSYLWL